MASTNALHVTNLFSLKDHVCLVTGGGTGIGLMASQALAANGAKVYITGRRTDVLDQAATEHSPRSSSPSAGQIIPIGPCDVTKKDDLMALVSRLEAKEHYLSLFVAAAGVPGPKADPDAADAADARAIQAELWRESVDEWNATYSADVTGVYFSTVAVLPLLQAAPRGHEASVIVISSMSGLMRHAQAHFAYNAAKAATAHLSRMMSREFGKAGVRVNSIAPGYFPSEMTMKESDERNKTHMPDEKVKDKGHEVPAGRSGTDEEMAQLVLFFAACGYVNGQGCGIGRGAC